MGSQSTTHDSGCILQPSQQPLWPWWSLWQHKKVYQTTWRALQRHLTSPSTLIWFAVVHLVILPPGIMVNLDCSNMLKMANVLMSAYSPILTIQSMLELGIGASTQKTPSWETLQSASSLT